MSKASGTSKQNCDVPRRELNVGCGNQPPQWKTCDALGLTEIDQDA